MQESLPEDLGMKREAYGVVEKFVREDVVIASSTSGILPSALQAGMVQCVRFWLKLVRFFNIRKVLG